MEAFFRAVAIGLGVLMGTLNPGVEPELELSVHKGAGPLIVSGSVVRALSPTIDEALNEGVVMALTLQTAVDGRLAPAVTQTLAYQPLSRTWVVSGPGEQRRSFSSRAQAEKAWVNWDEVPAGNPAGVSGSEPFTVTAEVVLSFPGRPDWKADMVWKTPSVTWSKVYARLSEVPF